MIARLRGKLISKSPGEVIVDVGGVGYHAFVSLSTFCRLPAEGAEVELETVTNLRENALELFGFLDADERKVFHLLRGISGIGPRLALTILSGITPDELEHAVREGAISRLVAVPGVGKKTAERVLVELRGRLENILAPQPGGEDGAERDAITALVALGYKEAQARAAVSASREEGEGGVEALIRRALARLA